jgi:hypothetical protein
VIWIVPSIELASVYWFIALILAGVLTVLSVQAWRAGAPRDMVILTIVSGLGPIIVSVTPAWELYPVAGGAALWASRALVARASSHTLES